MSISPQLYEGQAFQDGGFAHHELYFPDGSCPTNDIVLRFLDICEGEAGGVAVHCKAGLGRTGATPVALSCMARTSHVTAQGCMPQQFPGKLVWCWSSTQAAADRSDAMHQFGN